MDPEWEPPIQTVLRINLIFIQLQLNITRFVIELLLFLKLIYFFFRWFCRLSIANYAVWWQRCTNAEQILDRAGVTATQIALHCSTAKNRGTRIDHSVDEVLSVHLPEAMKKAIAQLPTVREQQTPQGAEEQIVEGRRQEGTSRRSENSCRIHSVLCGDSSVQLLSPAIS